MVGRTQGVGRRTKGERVTDLHILGFSVLGGVVGVLWALAMTKTMYTPYINFYRELNKELKELSTALEKTKENT